MKRVTIGGGTFQPIRNHLALCAPAFGSTAKKLHYMFKTKELPGDDSVLYLTKMADSTSTHLQTNEDVFELIKTLCDDKEVKTIVLNVAFCDFRALPIDNIESGFHAERLKTAEGNITIELEPTEKVISYIRKVRPDIFLVGFKTTTNKTSQEQFEIALKMMKSTKCNIVLANDTTTRNRV